MKRKSLCNIVLALLLSVAAYAEDTIAVDSVVFVADTLILDTTATEQPQPEQAKPQKEKKQIYGGTQIKLDILSPILTPALNNWQMQHYELAVNVQLARRFYPTLELGYALGQTHNDSVQYSGQGGFARIGCDINPLKKHPESPHALLVGIRVGTAVQDKGETDCWGEIDLGCQVNIAKGFYMGWMGRIKLLFTREKEGQSTRPIYIPGYGLRDNVSWGVNYYLGYKF